MRKNRSRYLLVIVILFFSLLVRYSSLFATPKYYANQLSSSYLYYSSCIFKLIKNINHYVKSNKDLTAENTILTEHIRYLEDQIERNSTLDHNLRVLKEQVNYVNSYQYHIVTTELFAINSNNITQEAYIRAGTQDGIEEGQAVLFNKFLIGKVLTVYDNYSKILLIFDKRSKIPAITSVSKQHVIIEGSNQQKLYLKYLPDKPTIESEEILFTSNYSQIYPKNLKIAIITKENDQYYAKAPYALKDIDLVQILKDNHHLRK